MTERRFSDLTDASRIRRLRRLAWSALSRYPIAVSRLRFLAEHTNVTYRVDTKDGRVFALRVGTTLEDTDVDVASEIAWLGALAREGDVSVVRPWANVDGELVTVADAPGVPEERRCVLFSWLPGSVLADRISTARYSDFGELAAQLHEHGERWRPPRTFRPLVWDRVFYYPTEPVVLFDPRYRRWMTPERTETVRRAIETITPELRRLHREGRPHVIHGDLQMGNVMVHRGRLTAFDFEDVMRGAPVQDIAITLSYGRARPDYGELRRAFRAGYERRRGWPVEFEGQLELLMAARKVMFLNYLLRTDPEPGNFIAASMPDLRRLVRGVSILDSGATPTTTSRGTSPPPMTSESEGAWNHHRDAGYDRDRVTAIDRATPLRHHELRADRLGGRCGG